jgi:hypothetical protein
MLISEFIAWQGLKIDATRLHNETYEIRVAKGGESFVTGAVIGEGRAFNQVGFLSVLQDRFRGIEKPRGARADEPGDPAEAWPQSARESFKTLVGEQAYRLFIENVRKPS